MLIRSWEDSDTDWWVGLRLASDTAIGEEQLRLLAAGQVAAFAHRRVACIDSARVGYAAIAYPPGQAEGWAHVLVPQDRRGQGIGSALFSDLLRHSSDATLTTSMPDDDPRSLAIARHWGFEEVSHAVQSELDLRAHPPEPSNDPSRHWAVVDAGSPPAEKVWLDSLLTRSDTSPEAIDLGWRSTVATFERMFPNIVWVVLEDDGMAVAAASAACQQGDAWLVIYTGVLPEHRRKGLARLAKEQLHALVAQRGGRTLSTDNEARNDGIRHLNASLGYVRTGGEIRLRRIAPPA
jgi:GNAT superfamily N-acetyltransferase